LVHIQIAIDGPAGAGKSTIARILAEKLGFIYIDTGAMYRAITYAALQNHIPLDDSAGLKELAARTRIDLVRSGAGAQLVLLDGRDVSEEIRSPLVSQKVSLVASHPGVREALVRKQQQMAECQDVVMDGRDIGTVVLPNADVKIYLTASLAERARRRYEEMRAKGYAGTYDQVKADVEARDDLDQNRAVSPLRAAPDAVCLDTTDSTPEEIVQRILQLIREKKRG